MNGLKIVENFQLAHALHAYHLVSFVLISSGFFHVCKLVAENVAISQRHKSTSPYNFTFIIIEKIKMEVNQNVEL